MVMLLFCVLAFSVLLWVYYGGGGGLIGFCVFVFFISLFGVCLLVFVCVFVSLFVLFCIVWGFGVVVFFWGGGLLKKKCSFTVVIQIFYKD